MTSLTLKVFWLSLAVSVHAFPLHMKEGTILDDSEIHSFLHALVDPALKVTPQVPKISFHLIASPMVNAFTAGEPSIFIYTGLIEKIKSPEELIGVLFHELGHIVGHHVIQKIAEMKRTFYHHMVPALLGLMAAGASGRWELAPMGLALGQINSAVAQLGHSRDHESFADRFALQTLAKLGWPDSCFFRIMELFASQEHTDYPLYLRTHPFAKDRLKVAPSSKVASARLPENFFSLFQRAKVKLVAFSTPLSRATQAVESLDIAPSIRPYGRAIVAYRSGKYDQALEELLKFEKTQGFSPFIEELKAQILFESHRFDEALAAINRALKHRPHDHSMGAYKAYILIEQGHPRQAIPLLERLLLDSSHQTPELWYWLAVAYGREHNMGRMKVCMAEHAFMIGDIKQARCYIESGLKILPSHDTYYQRAKDLKTLLEQDEHKFSRG